MRRIARWARNLHAGQLVILCLVCAVGAGWLYKDGKTNLSDSRTNYFLQKICDPFSADYEECNALNTFREHMEAKFKAIGLGEYAGATALVVFGLVTTWLWFGGRKGNEREPTS